MRYILKISTFLSIVLPTIVFGSAVVVDIPFVKEAGLILIEANIDGENGSLIFDTGANTLMLNEKLFNNSINHQMHSITGSMSSKTMIVEKVIIGNYILEDNAAFSMDVTELERMSSQKILGIVGASLFESELLEIDNINKTIKIYPRSKFTRSSEVDRFYFAPIDFESEIPVVTIKIAEENYRFALDTGASISVIDSSIAKKLKLQGTDDPSFEILTATGKVESQVKSIHKLRLGNLTLQDLFLGTMDLTHINSELENPINGLLSINQLPFQKLILDYQSGTIYFTE